MSSVVCETLNIFQSSLCEARCWRLWKNCSKKLVLGIFLKPCLNGVKAKVAISLKALKNIVCTLHWITLYSCLCLVLESMKKVFDKNYRYLPSEGVLCHILEGFVF